MKKILLIGIITIGMGACTEPNYRENKKIVIRPKEKVVEVEEVRKEKVMIKLDLSTNFDFDKFDLKKESKDKIDEFAKKLEGLTGDLNITGHTDTIGSEEYNKTLSKKRAESVWEELKKSIKEDSYNVKVKGMGEMYPLVEEFTKEDREKNRRVEVIFTEK